MNAGFAAHLSEGVLFFFPRSSWRRRVPSKEAEMKYMLLIQYGDTPVPPSEEWDRLSQDEQKAVFAGYQAVNECDPRGRRSRRAAPCPRPP
jgi:hypothetical protein